MTSTVFLAERLRSIMQLKHFTIAKLAAASNVSEDTIKSIRSGRTLNPGIQVLIQLADALSCSLDELVGRPSLSEADASLLRNYSMLSEQTRNLIDLIMNSELKSSVGSRATKVRQIHCLTAHAFSEGGYVFEPQPEMLSLPVGYMDKADFAIQVDTDYLAPYFFPNDYLAIQRRFPNRGETGAFIKNGLAYLRRYEEQNGKMMLFPLTMVREAEPLPLDDSFTCLGTFIGIMHLDVS